jgi:hypothetical protein
MHATSAHLRSQKSSSGSGFQKWGEIREIHTARDFDGNVSFLDRTTPRAA